MRRRIFVSPNNAEAIARHPAMTSYVTAVPTQAVQQANARGNTTAASASHTSLRYVFHEDSVKVTNDPQDTNASFAAGTSGIDLICYKSAVFLLRMSDGDNSSASGGAGAAAGDEDDSVDDLGEDESGGVLSFDLSGGGGRKKRGDYFGRARPQSFEEGSPGGSSSFSSGSLYPRSNESRDAFLSRRYATIASGRKRAPLTTRMFFMIVYCDVPQPDLSFMTWCNMTAVDHDCKLLLVWTAQEAAAIFECLLSDAYNNEGRLQASVLTAGKPFSASLSFLGSSSSCASPSVGAANGGNSSTTAAAAVAPSSLSVIKRNQLLLQSAQLHSSKGPAEYLQNAFAAIPTIQKTDTTRLLNEARSVAELLLSDPTNFVDRIPLFTRKKAERLREVFNAEFPTTATRLEAMQYQLLAEERQSTSATSDPSFDYVGHLGELEEGEGEGARARRSANVGTFVSGVDTYSGQENSGGAVARSEEGTLLEAPQSRLALTSGLSTGNSESTPTSFGRGGETVDAALSFATTNTMNTCVGTSGNKRMQQHEGQVHLPSVGTAGTVTAPAPQGTSAPSTRGPLSFSQAMVQEMLRRAQDSDSDDDGANEGEEKGGGGGGIHF